jgi:hypothetical protein
MFLGAQPGHALAALAGYPTPTARGASLLGWWSGDHSHESIAASGYDPDISGASWTKWKTTVTPNQSDPDGGNNAFLLTDSNDMGTPVYHYIQDLTMSAATALPQWDVWLKAGTQFEHYLVVGDVGGANYRASFVRSDNGVIVTQEAGARCHHIETRGDWKLFRLLGEASTQNAQLFMLSGGTGNYAGTGTGTFYFYSPAGSYRARLIQDADGVAPDVSSAQWSKLNATVTAGIDDPFGGTGAFRLTDTVDGSAVPHSITDDSPNAILNAPVDLIFWVKPRTQNTLLALAGVAGGINVRANVNAATGAVGGATGGAQIEHIGNGPTGWRKFRLRSLPTTWTNVAFFQRNSDDLNAVTAYQGNGTGTVDVYLESYQQRRAAHLPLVGSSSLAVQATDATRPILTADHFAGTKSLLFSGAQAVNADHIAAAHNFRTQDWTIICLADFTASPSADESLWCLGTSGNQILTLYRDAGGMLRVLLTSYGTGPTYDFALGPGMDPLHRQAIAVVHRTVGSDKTLEFYRNGSGGGGNIIAPAAINYATLTIGAVRSAPYGNYFQGRMREIGIFSAALSPTDVRMMSYGMRARGRLSPGGL